MPTTSQSTTLQESVNIVLSVLGEAPVNSLTGTTSSLALNIIEEVSTDIQSKGWWFNQQTNSAYDSTANVLIYASNSGGNWSSNIPEEARRYITIRSARIAHSRIIGTEENFKFTYQEELVSLAILQQAHVRNAGSELTFSSYPSELKGLGIDEFIFLTGNVEDKLGSLKLATEIKTQRRVEEEIDLLEAQATTEGSKQANLAADTTLKGAQATTEASQQSVLGAQATNIAADTTLKGAQATNVGADSSLKTAQATTEASQQTLLAAQSTNVGADTTLKGSQSANVQADTTLKGSQSTLVSAQATTEGSQQSLLAAQTTTEGSKQSNIAADTTLKGSQSTLVSAQATTEGSQQTLLGAQATTETNKQANLTADTALKGAQATTEASQQTLLGAQATNVGADTTLKGSQSTLVSAQATTEGSQQTLLGAQATTEASKQSNLAADTTLKGAQATTEASQQAVLSAQASNITADTTLKGSQSSNVQADTTLKGAQATTEASQQTLLGAQATNVGADTTLKGSQSSNVQADTTLKGAQTAKLQVEKDVIEVQKLKTLEETVLTSQQVAKTDAETELLKDTEAKTVAEKDVLVSQKNKLDDERTLSEAEKDYFLFSGVIVNGVARTYKDYRAELRIMGYQETQFNGLPAYKKKEALTDAANLRSSTVAYATSGQLFDSVNNVLELIGEIPVADCGDNLLATKAKALLEKTDTELQARGWWFNTETDVVLTISNGIISYASQMLNIEVNGVPTTKQKVSNSFVVRNLETKRYDDWSGEVKATIIYKRDLDETPQKYIELLEVRVARLLTELYPQSGIDIQRLPKMEAELNAYFKDRENDQGNYSVFDNYDAAVRVGINRSYNLF